MENMTISANKKELNKVLDFINGNLDSLNPSPKFRMQLELAVEEAFANIVNYAYNEENKKNSNNSSNRVAINYYVKENPLKVIVEFLDQGTPYNPLKNEDPDITLSSDNREIGGLGIFLIKKNVDNLDYKYENNQNILKLEKTLE